VDTGAQSALEITAYIEHLLENQHAKNVAENATQNIPKQTDLIKPELTKNPDLAN
jgi:hypothetical protein